MKRFIARKITAVTVYQTDKPQVGVAVIIFRQGKFLLGQRKKTPGANSWQCPGGFMQIGESVFEAARREVEAETGLFIHNLEYGPYTNNRFVNEGAHTVTLYVLAEYMSGEAAVKEKDQAKSWQWFDLNELPQPLFLPLQILVDKHGDWLKSVA
jgi:8-oxo-dGTP diphosphatase